MGELRLPDGARCINLLRDRYPPPMFTYFGAKHRLAAFYPGPLHSTVVEPFAGSAAYAMHHARNPAVERILLIEKDARVVETWRRVLSMSVDDLRTYRVPAAGEETTDFLVMTAATSNAVARCRKMTVTPRQVRAMGMMLRRMAGVLEAAKAKVEVVEGDYRKAPDIEASWFIDPPYSPSPRAGTRTSRPQGAGYAKGCDSASLDYSKLAEWARSRTGQTIVCESHGAAWLPFEPLRRSADSMGRPMREVCWATPEQPRAEIKDDDHAASDAVFRLRRAARARLRSEEAFREAIFAGRAEGMSLRVLADAAGVSHMHVARIVRATKS
jgi:hypothetical protein